VKYIKISQNALSRSVILSKEAVNLNFKIVKFCRNVWREIVKYSPLKIYKNLKVKLLKIIILRMIFKKEKTKNLKILKSGKTRKLFQEDSLKIKKKASIMSLRMTVF